jgi:hypothetical protein
MGSAEPPARVPFLGDASWFLHRIDLARGELAFVRTSREAVSGEPFLDGRWDAPAGPSKTLPIMALKEAPRYDLRPGFIWHSSFCCSTLIASCLDWPGVAVSLKEPQALVDLAALRDHGDGTLAQGVARLLGRPFTPGERVLIKPSNAANGLLNVVGEAAGRHLLLHTSLRRFLLSVAKGSQVRLRFARALLSDRVVTGHAPFGLRDVSLFTDLQAAALSWRLQMREFDAFAARLGPERVRRLDGETFMQDPATELTGLDEFFELGLGPQRIAEIVGGPKLRQYAKDPSRTFESDRDAGELALAERWIGPQLGELEAWSGAVMQQLGL